MGTLGDNNIITLTWNAYTGWQNGVDHYVVEKFNEQGQLLQTFNSGTTTLVDDEEDFDNQTYVYRITAVANDAGIIKFCFQHNHHYQRGYSLLPNGFYSEWRRQE